MEYVLNGTIAYSILNPTGNITALAETRVEPERQPAVAADIMKLHPEVEQVGFLNLALPDGCDVQAELRMAGGEFCGNAAMCAAAMYFLRNSMESGEDRAVSAAENREKDRGETGFESDWVPVRIRVSGVTHPVQVRLKAEEKNRFAAGVKIPSALEIGKRPFTFQSVEGELPLVSMEGISHIVIEENSSFFELREKPGEAEKAVREWCNVLSASCLGLMFLERGTDRDRLTPLVFVPESGTVFWENSCASGSSAVGMYLAKKGGVPVEITLFEPGGSLQVRSDLQTGETWLFGHVSL